MTADPATTVTITAADIETWARVQRAIAGKAVELCAAGCDHPPRPCTACGARNDPAWRRDALRVIKGGLA